MKVRVSLSFCEGMKRINKPSCNDILQAVRPELPKTDGCLAQRMVLYNRCRVKMGRQDGNGSLGSLGRGWRNRVWERRNPGQERVPRYRVRARPEVCRQVFQALSISGAGQGEVQPELCVCHG